jgi:hypothetical protein
VTAETGRVAEGPSGTCGLSGGGVLPVAEPVKATDVRGLCTDVLADGG